MSSKNCSNIISSPIHINSFYNNELSAFLDAARWISALSVLITHLNNRMFILLSDIPVTERSLISYLWGFICGFAHWGVVVFFVLSGFLVGGPILTLLIDNQEFNAKKYLSARITRIYLVLIPVLIIGNGLDYLGIYLFSQSGVYDEFIPRINEQSMLTIIGSLLNLQGLFIDGLGTNGPLGTLANEFWYYLTFPLILAPFLYKKQLKGWLLFGIGICLLLFMSLASKWHFVGFFLWCIGALFAIHKRPLIYSPLLAFCLFIGLLLLIRVGIRSQILAGQFGFIFEIIIAVSFASLISSLKYTTVNWSVLKWNCHEKLGSFSYSLYAIHVPLITFMCAALKNKFGYGWHEIPRYNYQWLTALIFLSICILIAWLLSLLTEKHTYRLRKFANNIIEARALQ